jgi:CheY-like chemotaxis protein
MGSEFTVRLPVLKEDQAEPKDTRPSINSVHPGSLPRRRILVVDDNVQAADSLGRLLSVLFSQDVRVVYDGLSALDLAPSFRPDVVLLDLDMIVIDGYEVARRLRARQETSHACVVAVTGWAQEEYRRRTDEMGFDLHLVKPITADDLQNVLGALGPMTDEYCVVDSGEQPQDASRRRGEVPEIKQEIAR